MSGAGEGFLSRWSRKKRAEVREEPGVEEGAAPVADAPAPPEPDASARTAPDSEPTLSDEELAALPPIHAIDATTDISGYLRKGVPAALKNAALRRVWSATPAVRDYLDPARDYAWDWNVPGGVPGDGPLAPGFDAKALADKLFAKRAPKVEDDVDRQPSGENTNDAVSQSADTDPSSPRLGANGAEGGAEPAQDRGAATVGENAAEHGVPVRSDAPRPERAADGEVENTRELSGLRPRQRRHGGATPV